MLQKCIVCMSVLLFTVTLIQGQGQGQGRVVVCMTYKIG